MCLAIVGWAQEIWEDIEGRCIMAGIDFDIIEADAMVSVFYSMIIDDVAGAGVSRFEARNEIKKRLDETFTTLNMQRETAKGNKVEAEPFNLTPEMMQTLGLPMPKMPPKAGG